LSNLDAALRGDMRVELSQLHRNLSATMVYVTHDQVEAMTMADRIVVLNGGRVEQFGTPMELYHHPRTKFVAGFIGQPNMNFVPATVRGIDAGGLAVELPGGQTIVLPVDPSGVSAGARVDIGLRPEDVVPGDGIEVHVSVVERLGGVSIAYGHLADGAKFCASLGGTAAITEGAPMSLGFDPASAHVFDAGGRVLRRMAAPAIAV